MYNLKEMLLRVASGGVSVHIIRHLLNLNNIYAECKCRMEGGNTMKKFIEKHSDNIDGVLSCADRIIFKGYSFLSWCGNMERFLIG